MSTVLMRLLTRMVPGIYADPQRARPCFACQQLVTPDRRYKPDVVRWVCSAECMAEAQEMDAL